MKTHIGCIFSNFRLKNNCWTKMPKQDNNMRLMRMICEVIELFVNGWSKERLKKVLFKENNFHFIEIECGAAWTKKNIIKWNGRVRKWDYNLIWFLWYFIAKWINSIALTMKIAHKYACWMQRTFKRRRQLWTREHCSI